MSVSFLVIPINPKLSNMEKAEGNGSHTAGYTLINKSNFFVCAKMWPLGILPEKKNINQHFPYWNKAMNNQGGLRL